MDYVDLRTQFNKILFIIIIYKQLLLLLLLQSSSIRVCSDLLVVIMIHTCVTFSTNHDRRTGSLFVFSIVINSPLHNTHTSSYMRFRRIYSNILRPYKRTRVDARD